MLTNMDRIATLPPTTQVFCAHEYTQSNYKFLNAIDPDRCGGKYEEIIELREANIPTIPTTIGDELQYNLFMQCRDPILQSKLGTIDDPIATMAVLRQRKNEFS
jgi:hydroxyacylglutathione hydrolase